MNKEEKAFHFLVDDYMNIPKVWEDYQIIKNAIEQNKQLKSILDEIREYINDDKIFDGSAMVHNDLLQILDKAKENTEKEEIIDNNTIINENCKNFKCVCGANVFSKTNKGNYICHCCNRSYCEAKESK